MIFVETGRLILRRPKPGDYEAYLHSWSDPEMSRYTGLRPNVGEFIHGLIEEMRAKLPGEQGANGPWYQYSIERRRDGALVGDIGIGFGVPGERRLPDPPRPPAQGLWPRSPGRDHPPPDRDARNPPLRRGRSFAQHRLGEAAPLLGLPPGGAFPAKLPVPRRVAGRRLFRPPRQRVARLTATAPQVTGGARSAGR